MIIDGIAKSSSAVCLVMDAHDGRHPPHLPGFLLFYNNTLFPFPVASCKAAGAGNRMFFWGSKLAFVVMGVLQVGEISHFLLSFCLL
jgi:hypothetical protein